MSFAKAATAAIGPSDAATAPQAIDTTSPTPLPELVADALAADSSVTTKVSDLKRTQVEEQSQESQLREQLQDRLTKMGASTRDIGNAGFRHKIRSSLKTSKSEAQLREKLERQKSNVILVTTTAGGTAADLTISDDCRGRKGSVEVAPSLMRQGTSRIELLMKGQRRSLVQFAVGGNRSSHMNSDELVGR